jgi:fido (protein-threonine AMPylation protein)
VKNVQIFEADEFSHCAGHYLGEINVLHPFREPKQGNGRTQREFISQVADKAGYHIAWIKVSRDEKAGEMVLHHRRCLGIDVAELHGRVVEIRYTHGEAG